MTRCPQTTATVLEVRGRQIGVLVPDHQHYLFFAAVSDAACLDGTRFRSVAEGERRVARLLKDPRRAKAPTVTPART